MTSTEHVVALSLSIVANGPSPVPLMTPHAGGESRPAARGAVSPADWPGDTRVREVLVMVRGCGDGVLPREMDAGRVEGLLAMLVLTAEGGLPMTVSVFARVLTVGSGPAMSELRTLVGVGGGLAPAVVRGRVDRLVRGVLDRVAAVSELLDEMTGRLLAASTTTERPAGANDAHCAPAGGLVLLRGFAAPAGSLAGSKPTNEPDPDAGWWARPDRPGSTKYSWGYEVDMAVAVPNPAPGRQQGLGTVAGVRLHRPGLDPVPFWLGLLTDARSRPGTLPGARPSVWLPWPPDRGWGVRLASGVRHLGFRAMYDGGDDGVPTGAAGWASVHAEAALDRAGASRRGAGQVLAGVTGTTLVVACEFAAWNRFVAGRSGTGRWQSLC